MAINNSDVEKIARRGVDYSDPNLEAGLLAIAVEQYQSAMPRYAIARRIPGVGLVLPEAEKCRRETCMKVVGFLAAVIDEHMPSSEGIPTIDRITYAVQTGIDPISQDRVGQLYEL